MKNKILIGMGVLVFVILAVVVFVVQKKNTSEMETQNQGQIQEEQKDDFDVSNWKTYTSNGWGYSIKYPANLFIKSDTQGEKFPGDTSRDIKLSNGEISHWDGGQTLIISDKERMGVQDIMPNEEIHIDIYTFKINSNHFKGQTWEQYFNDSKNGLSKKKINGFDAYYKEPSLGEGGSVSLGVFIIKDSWVYHLSGINFVDKKLGSQNMELMRKIISTFEFTK